MAQCVACLCRHLTPAMTVLLIEFNYILVLLSLDTFVVLCYVLYLMAEYIRTV